uniref:Uncharacterized protein n=1 Tax=Triticum urartu TaxID=4572 RepID=A0A8R7PWM1_TRIUA
MDGDGFDVWGSQPSASGPATHAGLDLNSQAPVSEGFPGLGLYGAFLQSDDDEVLPGRVRGSGLPPYRPPYARRLNFGGSSAAAAGRGGGNGGVFLGGSSSGAGGGVRQRANSAAAAPSRLRGVLSVRKHPALALPLTMVMKNWRMTWKSLRAPEVPR